MNQQTPAQPRTFGRYYLLEKIGEGGMAEVFRAEIRFDAAQVMASSGEHTDAVGFRKEFALKIITKGQADRPDFLSWFIGEARLGSCLDHSNIVSTQDFGHVEGRHFIAMELVRGPTLDRVLEVLRSVNKPMPTDIVIQLGIQLARGLEYAHQATGHEGQPLKMVHRDLKPSNLFIRRDGILKIGDFGVARSEENVHRTTVGGVVKGTIRYMSPEQARGQIDIDFRSDLFSAGVILYEMLAGVRLYTSQEPLALLHEVLGADLAPFFHQIPERPAREPLCSLLQQMLVRSRDNRIADANLIVERLEQIRLTLPSSDRVELKQWLKEVLELARAHMGESNWDSFALRGARSHPSHPTGTGSIELDPSVLESFVGGTHQRDQQLSGSISEALAPSVVTDTASAAPVPADPRNYVGDPQWAERDLVDEVGLDLWKVPLRNAGDRTLPPTSLPSSCGTASNTGPANLREILPVELSPSVLPSSHEANRANRDAASLIPPAEPMLSNVSLPKSTAGSSTHVPHMFDLISDKKVRAVEEKKRANASDDEQDRDFYPTVQIPRTGLDGTIGVDAALSDAWISENGEDSAADASPRDAQDALTKPPIMDSGAYVGGLARAAAKVQPVHSPTQVQSPQSHLETLLPWPKYSLRREIVEESSIAGVSELLESTAETTNPQAFWQQASWNSSATVNPTTPQRAHQFSYEVEPTSDMARIGSRDTANTIAEATSDFPDASANRVPRLDSASPSIRRAQPTAASFNQSPAASSPAHDRPTNIKFPSPPPAPAMHQAAPSYPLPHSTRVESTPLNPPPAAIAQVRDLAVRPKPGALPPPPPARIKISHVVLGLSGAILAGVASGVIYKQFIAKPISVEVAIHEPTPTLVPAPTRTPTPVQPSITPDVGTGTQVSLIPTPGPFQTPAPSPVIALSPIPLQDVTITLKTQTPVPDPVPTPVLTPVDPFRTPMPTPVRELSPVNPIAVAINSPGWTITFREPGSLTPGKAQEFRLEARGPKKQVLDWDIYAVADEQLECDVDPRLKEYLCFRR